ncbi:MAG: hypothetical protein ACJ73S_28990 [Mycobacteriales bacterium]
MTTVVLRPRPPGGLISRADKAFLATARIEARPDAVVITDGAGNTTTIGWDDPDSVEGVRHTTHFHRPSGRGSEPDRYTSLIDVDGRALAVLPLGWWDIDEVKQFATTIDVPWHVDLRQWQDPPPPRADRCVELWPVGSGVVTMIPLVTLVVLVAAAVVTWAVTGQWLWVGVAALILAVGGPLVFRFLGPRFRTELTLTGTPPEERP